MAKAKAKKQVKKTPSAAKKPPRPEKKAVKKPARAAAKVIEKVAPKPILIDDPGLVELLKQIAGENGFTVAKAIFAEELTDDEIAKRTGIRLNLVRRILYDLYDSRVVSYRRVRDENSGWYIYYWKIEPERALGYVNSNRRLLIQKLEEQLERERSTTFFTCGDGCSKMTFEEAAENDFKCLKCKGKLEVYDNTGVITALESRVQSLKKQLLEGY